MQTEVESSRQINQLKTKISDLESIKSELLSEKATFIQEKGTTMIQSKEKEQSYLRQLADAKGEAEQLKAELKVTAINQANSTREHENLNVKHERLIVDHNKLA